MRIAFILPTFTAGGAERVASLLCNYWAEQGHDVTALTFEGAGDEQVYRLDERVTLRGIDALNRNRRLASRVRANVRRLSRLRAALKAFQPDAVVAFTTEANVVAIWSALGLGVPVVVSERNQPDRPGLGRFTRAVRRLSYPFAASLVVQTEAIAQWSRARFGPPVQVLPNPVRLASWVGAPRAERATKRIVAAGRLVPQKGFDVLIASFAALADDLSGLAACHLWRRRRTRGSRDRSEALSAWRSDRASGPQQGYARGVRRGRPVRAVVAL